MRQTIAHLTLVVRNYDEALDFFTQKLGFQLLADSPLPDGKRWVLVAPSHSKGAALLLAEAATPQQSLAIGNQTGGCVFLFLHTDDFWRDFHAYQSRGVRFLETPQRALRHRRRLRRSLRQQVGPPPTHRPQIIAKRRTLLSGRARCLLRCFFTSLLAHFITFRPETHTVPLSTAPPTISRS